MTNYTFLHQLFHIRHSLKKYKFTIQSAHEQVQLNMLFESTKKRSYVKKIKNKKNSPNTCKNQINVLYVLVACIFAHSDYSWMKPDSLWKCYILMKEYETQFDSDSYGCNFMHSPFLEQVMVHVKKLQETFYGAHPLSCRAILCWLAI